MTKVTRKAATKAKTGGTKTATKAKAAPKESEGKTRRTQADVDALVPDFLKRIKDGATLRALKAEFGFSDDGPIRAALYRAGYDRKGEAHGEDEGSIDASKAAGKKQLVALRANEGAAWYRLAYLAGITEAEAKTIVTDAGGEVGRVYVKTEKPAAAKKAGKTNGGSTAAKKSGSKANVKRADPSPQA
jgi:hypothetical protein